MKKKPTPTKLNRPAKQKAGGGCPGTIYSQFWVIDTDTPGMSKGQFSASGPYLTQSAAEESIVDETRNLWETSCACFQSEKKIPWSNPLHIVEVRRTVIPKITAKVGLIDTSNVQALIRARKEGE